MGNRPQPRVIVSVFDGPYLVETRTCRYEAVPDGSSGVLYRGLVHPLLEGNRIDLSGPAFAPGVQLADVAPARETRHIVVRGDASGYVLIEGPVTAREAAAFAVRGAGAEVVSNGRYLGAGFDAFSPDWFVRFELSGSTFESIEAALGGISEAHGSGDETAAEIRVRLLMTELAQARARIAAAAAENARLRVERAEMSTAAAAADADALARLEAERAALQEALIAESSAREAAEALAAEASPVVARPGVPRALTSEVESVIRALMPRVRLVRDSLAFSAVELLDRGPLYRALGHLEARQGGWPPGWKKLQATNGWWERHLSDGASDAGRLYARLNPSDRTLDVLVSNKGEQPRDLAWLRRG